MIRNATVGIALVVALGDCRMCKKDPPQILFPGPEGGVELPVADAGDSDAIAAPTGDDAGVVPRTAAQRAQGDGRTIVVNGVTVNAPERSAFVEYLTQDVDSDGDADLVATVTRSNGNAGVLLFLRDEASFVAATSSNADAPARACVPAGLVAYSPKTWALRYEQCTGSVDAGIADQQSMVTNSVVTEYVALSVDAAGAVGKMRVSEFGPSLPRTRLGVDLVYLDRDGDGRADLSVDVGAWRESDAPDARARASVVLLDRGMGFARDTSEPAASVARLLAQVRTLAATRRRAPEALAMIERVQRLRRALCVEAGAPRLRIGSETGLRCANMFNGFSEAFARALLALGELPAAESTQWPDSAPEFGAVESERFDQELQRAAGSETGITARSGPFLGGNLDDWPLRSSALALDPAGTPTHVLLRGTLHNRVELATFALGAQEDGAATELALRSPDGARMAIGVWQTCDGVVVGFCPVSDANCANAPYGSVAPPAGAVLARLSDLPSTEFGARCLRREASSEPIRRPSDVRALGWGNEGVVLAWRGRLMRASGEGAPFVAVGSAPLGGGFTVGSAVSADGRLAALQGADAVYVRDAAGRWKGWRPPTLSGRTRQLGDLTISGDGRVVAGRVGTQLWVIERLAAGPAVAPSPR